MTGAGIRGGRAGVTLAVGLLCAAAWARHGGGTPVRPAEGAGPLRAAAHTAVRTAALLPRVGVDILPETLTCARARARTTPTTAAQCATWAVSGPVNVVVAWTGAAALPPALQPPPAPWRRAAGGWLVARGRTAAAAAGCGTGVHDSQEQIELRIDAVTRRHLKLIHARCGGAAPLGVVFGDAHTDRWERRCGGDRAVDWDGARDDLVRALSRLPSFVRVEYAAPPRATRAYPGGCGQLVASDGRVAYVVMASPPS